MTIERKLTLLEYDDGVWKPSGEAVRCDRCKYWDPDHEPDQNRPCLRIPHASKVTAVDKAHVSDAEGWSAKLWTDADFGCALFEAKP